MKKLTKADRIQQDFRDYNKREVRFGNKPISFEEYMKRRTGKKRYRLKGAKPDIYVKPVHRASPEVPSGFGIGVAAPKKTENRYTGDKLLGIGTMHKSNMVPIFKAEDAEDIAKMRRN